MARIANERKTMILWLRKSLEFVLEKDWPTDRTKSKVHDLLDHVGRSGDPVPDSLIGFNPEPGKG